MQFAFTYFYIAKAIGLFIGGMYGIAGGEFNGQPIPAEESQLLLNVAGYSAIAIPVIYLLERVCNRGN